MLSLDNIRPHTQVAKGFLCWALWSLVVFDPVDDPTRNNVAWFLMGAFLRLSP